MWVLYKLHVFATQINKPGPGDRCGYFQIQMNSTTTFSYTLYINAHIEGFKFKGGSFELNVCLFSKMDYFRIVFQGITTSLVPRPIPSFSVLHAEAECTTLKAGNGPGYEARSQQQHH